MVLDGACLTLPLRSSSPPTNDNMSYGFLRCVKSIFQPPQPQKLLYIHQKRLDKRIDCMCNGPV
jgi:hypothetical protein